MAVEDHHVMSTGDFWLTYGLVVATNALSVQFYVWWVFGRAHNKTSKKRELSVISEKIGK